MPDAGLIPPGARFAGGRRELIDGDPLNRGLLGRWLFDDGDGRDLSPRGYHASPVNGPTQAAGRYGKAARLAGSAGPATTNWNIGVRPGLSGLQVPYTFSAKIFQINNTGFQAIFADYRNFPLELIKTLRVDDGTLRYFCRDAGFIQSLGSLSVPTNRWVHVAVVIDGTIAAPTGLFVVDTLSEVPSMAALAASVVTDLPVRIGASEHAMIGAGNDGFNGLIQDTGFWNRAVSRAELNRLRDEPFAGTSDSVNRLFFAVRSTNVVTSVSLTGISLTASAGSVAEGIAVETSGSAATSAAGTPTSSIGTTSTGSAATASAGTATSGIGMTVTGSALTTSAGALAYTIGFILTGAASTAAGGTLGTSGGDTSTERSLTGISMTALPGNVRVTGGTRWTPQAARAETVPAALGNTLQPPPRATGNAEADLQSLTQWANTMYDQMVKIHNVIGRLADHEGRIEKLEKE